jgi:hypothetical protein
MGRKPVARRLSVALPAELVRRAETDAAACGLNLRAFVAETLHASLAARCCQHQARDIPTEAEDADLP